ncbi:hypothetical protein GCM10009772_34240 [Pseudonocardia alni subsp. carboxydivorans]
MSWLFVSDTTAIMAQRRGPSATARPGGASLGRSGVPPGARRVVRDERSVRIDGLHVAPTVGDPRVGESPVTATSG